jgi:gliding motility-associated-like protein
MVIEEILKFNFKKYYQVLIVVLLTTIFSFTLVNTGDAQCAFVGPVTVPPGQTQSFSLEVLGAINNDLSDPNQGICGVFLEFSHNLIGELEINLISPSGTVVNMVGSIVPTNPTNLTRWNVSFVPCGDIASPDNGFSPIWSNNQPWGILGNFVGSYYPNDGCLEDFNIGPVNGFWQIEIVNSSLFNIATLRSFTILFCDPDGLDCSICLAKGGEISLEDSTYCLNASELVLDIDLTYIGFTPDPNDYGYLYLVSQNGIIQDTLGVPDLRNYVAGQYEICGFSYLLAEETEIVDQIIGETIDFLGDTLMSPNPPFCAALSSNCIPITIFPANDTTRLEQHICAGDSVLINGVSFRETGTYSVDAFDVNGCDSVISLNLTKYELDGIPASVPDLSCLNSTVQLGLLQLVTNFMPGELSYSWYDESFVQLNQSEFLEVDSAGIYHLIIQGESSLIICRDTFSFQVIDTRILHTPQISVSGSLCIGNTFEALINNPISGGNYVWTLVGGVGNITIKNGGIAADYIIQNGSNVEVCVILDDPCYITEQICLPVQLMAAPLIELPSDTTVCGTQILFDLPGLPGSGVFTFISGPDPTHVIDEISPTQFGILVAAPGQYQFEFELISNSCSFTYPLNITFSPDLFAVITPISTTLCDGDSVRLQFSLPIPGSYTVNLNVPGIGITSFSGLYHDTILSLDVPGSMFTIGLLSVFPDGNGDCFLMLNDQFSFNRYIVPDLSLIPDVSVCNQELTGGFATFVDFNELSSGVSGSLSFVNLEGAGTGNFPLVDFENVIPGRYAFLIRSDYSSGICPQAEDTIFINVMDCSCEDYTVQNDTIEVCGLDVINLNSYRNHSNNGSWVIINGPPSHSLNLQAGVSANFQGQPSGSYQFGFTLTNPKPFCNFQDTLHVESIPVFSSGEYIVDSIRICTGLDSIIRLSNWLIQNDPGGKWVYTGNPNLPPSILDSISGTVDIQGFSPGIYSFQYLPHDTILCFLPAPTINIFIESNINSQLPDSLSLNCDISNRDIGFLPANVPEYTFLWTTIGGMINPGEETQAIINISTEGLYILNLHNSINQCSVTDSVWVSKSEESIDSVEYLIQGPQCLELNTGYVSITNVFGGNPPYEYRAGTQIGDNAGFIDKLRSGTYILQVIDSDGCRWLDTIEIPPLVPKYVDIGPDRRGTPTDIFDLEFDTDIVSSEIDYWIWEIPDSDTCSSCNVWSISTSKTIPVLLTLVSTEGCTYRDTLWIFIDENFQFFFPDAFSPNKDGVNDEIQIFTNDASIKVEHFEIFDRWGNKVFYADNFFPANEKVSWDGNFESREALPAIYVYKLLVSRNGQAAVFFTGEFLLAR